MGKGLVFFALTKRGLYQLIASVRGGDAIFWVNQNVLEDYDFVRLRAEGLKLTNFTRWVDPADALEIRRAIEIITEHHADDTLFVEQR